MPLAAASDAISTPICAMGCPPVSPTRHPNSCSDPGPRSASGPVMDSRASLDVVRANKEPTGHRSGVVTVGDEPGPYLLSRIEGGRGQQGVVGHVDGFGRNEGRCAHASHPPRRDVSVVDCQTAPAPLAVSLHVLEPRRAAGVYALVTSGNPALSPVARSETWPRPWASRAPLRRVPCRCSRRCRSRSRHR